MQRQDFIVILAVMLFGAWAHAAQDPPRYLKSLVETRRNEESRKDPRIDEALHRTIRQVERAFEKGNANELERSLVDRKIYLSLKSRGEEAGYYGRSQVKFMFDKLFRQSQTRSFRYDPRDLERSDDDGAVFRAAWTYVVLERDESVTEHLRFRLERDDADWRISEIRASSR